MSFPDVAELLETLADPRMRHAALVHLPVAGSVFGLPLVAAWLWSGGRSRSLRGCVIGLYGIVAACALLALESGGAARALAGTAGVEGLALVGQHEQLARWVWLSALVPVVGALAASPAHARRWALALTLAGACACAAHVGLVGHLGGRAVYAFGVGLPAPKAAALEGLEPAEPSLENVSFVRDVKPMLEASCMGCHGPVAPAGGLDLSSRGTMLRGGGRGPALVPGDADASLLYRAAAWTDDELRMPAEGERLTPRQLELLRRWIEEEAVVEG